MSVFACGHCGADLQRRSGCQVCNSRAMLAAVGLARRRWQAAPWAVLLCVVSMAMVGAPEDDHIITVAPTGEASNAGVVTVTAHPGQAARVVFADEHEPTTNAGLQTQGSTHSPFDIDWQAMVPTALAWCAIAARLASILAGKRRHLQRTTGDRNTSG